MVPFPGLEIPDLEKGMKGVVVLDHSSYLGGGGKKGGGGFTFVLLEYSYENKRTIGVGGWRGAGEAIGEYEARRLDMGGGTIL